MVGEEPKKRSHTEIYTVSLEIMVDGEAKNKNKEKKSLLGEIERMVQQRVCLTRLLWS